MMIKISEIRKKFLEKAKKKTPVGVKLKGLGKSWNAKRKRGLL
jgi:hypothetical protein